MCPSGKVSARMRIALQELVSKRVIQSRSHLGRQIIHTITLRVGCLLAAIVFCCICKLAHPQRTTAYCKKACSLLCFTYSVVMHSLSAIAF
jgi:hypothetical protein